MAMAGKVPKVAVPNATPQTRCLLIIQTCRRVASRVRKFEDTGLDK